MSSNSDRYKEELDKVIAEGEKISKTIKSNRLRCVYTRIRIEYAGWYAKALKLVQQVLKINEKNFKSHGKSIQNNLTDATYVRGPRISESDYRFIHQITGVVPIVYMEDILCAIILVNDQKMREIVPCIEMQLGFIKEEKDQLENSILETELLIQADVFDTELEQAQYLNEVGFTEAAGVIADKVLKRHLFYVCERRGFITKKEVSDIKNTSHLLQLLRENERIDDITFQEIKPLVSIGNDCCHSSKPVKRKRVQKLIDGTQEVIKTVF